MFTENLQKEVFQKNQNPQVKKKWPLLSDKFIKPIFDQVFYLQMNFIEISTGSYVCISSLNL